MHQPHDRRVLGDMSTEGLRCAYASVREQDAKAGSSICDVYVTSSLDKLIAVVTDICFKKLDRDFFALLTGSNRVTLSKPRSAPTLKRPEPLVRASDTSDASSAASSTSDTPSVSSHSDVLILGAEMLSIIAERSGISIAELRKNKNSTFTDSGVDSQMSIQMLSDF